MVDIARTLNPNGLHLLRYMADADIRIMSLRGGAGSGKSFSVAQCLLFRLVFCGESALVIKKIGASLKNTIYEDFIQASRTLCLEDVLLFQQNTIRLKGKDARVDFCGMEDEERIKGISGYQRVFLDEATDFEYLEFEQIKLRLRGRKGQQIILAFNPIVDTHWLRTKFYDSESWQDIPIEGYTATCTGKVGKRNIQFVIDASRELLKVKALRCNSAKDVVDAQGNVTTIQPNIIDIQSTYESNWWIVGAPNGQYGYVDVQTIANFEDARTKNPNYYNIYALGEWGKIKTGSEFFAQFKIGQHTGRCEYDRNLPVHLSVDNNVLPYITTSIWQIEYADGTHIRQIAEVLGTPPHNSVEQSARLVVDWLKAQRYNDTIYVHADASTRSANTIDADKRSFIDLYIKVLTDAGYEVSDCVCASNPSISMTGEFINALLLGDITDCTLKIDADCKVSITDYTSVQKDKNGAILKQRVKDKQTGNSYERYGHLSDCMRYLVYDILREEYTRYCNARGRNILTDEGVVRYYNGLNGYNYDMRLTYLLPNNNDMCVMLNVGKVGDLFHITDIVMRQADGIDDVQELIADFGNANVVCECAKAYYPLVRDLRTEGYDVRLVKEQSDVDRRITAMSDYIAEHIRFNSEHRANTDEYGTFVTDLLNYNTSMKQKSAPIALSGLALFLLKNT